MTSKKFTPFEWTLIATANAFGKDKLDYGTRLLWAYEHINELEDLMYLAKEKPMYTAAVIAVRDAQMGVPSGFPVGLDSASSGIQLLSVLTRCEVGMRNTGVINTGECPSIYRKLTDTMGSNALLQAAKDAFMTWMYGSMAEPKKAFPKTDDLMEFFVAAKKVAPHACIIRDVLVNSWQAFATSHDWTMPNGNHVHKRVWQTKDTKVKLANVGHQITFRHTVNKGTDKGVSLAADITHSCDALVVAEMQARCNYNENFLEYALEKLAPYEAEITDRTEFVALGNLDNMDLDNLGEYEEDYLARMFELVQRSLEYNPFHLLIVHDDFKCLANHVERMRAMYNRILWDMYHSDLLFDIIEQVSGDRFQNAKFDPEVAAQILENDYAIN